MYIVVGLGNPGSKYSGTRHNVGFDVLDYMAERHGANLNKIKYKSLYNEIKLGGEKVVLLKPQTYMNKSGEAVLEIAQFYKVPAENIVVVQDDIDIKFGSLRIRQKGSAGSHNGMKSIIGLLGNDGFPRVKIGVGKAEPGEDLAEFVLGRFKPDERPVIDELVKKAADSIECLIAEGIDVAMNKYNR
ncbi:peptidyl-tRNA hydrolase [Andreesenia angusta]|uniref:Peptidyl-tRNA hydrolase n=1 Tax=Andreesenia angusta TaxID=39480 RepID=A0A1S1V5I8_9FIRM|nr:aminoacyl-tRNA hydrolase [Andreesenia angusta]OHW61764.1 peptidyl-tRNA hydrolase [Andreesenia angusta]